MIAQAHRVAIARILSDLIKADKLIEKSELMLYNTIQKQFGITQKDRIAAQYITITEAMNRIRELDDEYKQLLQDALLQTAKADNQCVAREALILLALKYTLQDQSGKYELLSCPSHGALIEDKFMVYIESDEYESVNDEIACEFDAISDKLRLWNFDFVYIPSITNHLSQMDANYMKDIIRYMKPTLSETQVERLYNSLTTITTESFTTQLLGAQMYMPQLRETAPSLLVNFATSWVIGERSGQKTAVASSSTYMNFLRIRIDDTTMDEVKRFIADYNEFLTHREYVAPQVEGDQLKYYGFYRALFDFLTTTNSKGSLMEDQVVIDLSHSSLHIGDNEVRLSPTQLAVYILILQQSILGYGLPHLRTEADVQNNEALCQALTARFRSILSSLGAPNEEWQFASNTRNIAAYVSHIRQKLREHIHYAPDVYLPYQIKRDGQDYYTTKVTLDKVYVRVTGSEDKLLRLW